MEMSLNHFPLNRGDLRGINASYRFLILLAFIYSVPPAQAQQHPNQLPDGTEGEVLTSPLIDSATGKPPKRNWNEFNLGFTTIKFGGGFLYDYAAFVQDDAAKVQMDSAGVVAENQFKLRDFRFTLSGALATKRAVTWKMGLMYDGVTDKWLVRETGLNIGLPELAGSVFIGRTKEGFSLNKVMNGYAGWTMERQMALDVIPILADGIKLLGYLPKPRLFWNAGVYTDLFSEGQSFSTYSWQTALRLGWRVMYDPDNNKIFHIGASYRYGKPLNNQIQLRSRPEANPGPYFMDSGKFSSDHSNHMGAEVYYSRGPMLIGTELLWHSFGAPTVGDPVFFGGDVVFTYVLTGESRAYSSASSIYGFIPVEKSVFEGGWGSVEALLRFSYLDLNEGTIQGGAFWRITPMVNWYLSDNIRFELAYGYGILNRYAIKGATQFFQTRVHFQII